MATTPINNIIRGGAQGRSIFMSALPVLSTSTNYNQGDLVSLNTGTSTIIPAATGNGANCLGVAISTIVNGLPKSPYQGTAVDASEAISDVGGPLYGVVASLTLDTGSTVSPGTVLYYSNVGPQNVTPTQPGSDVTIGIWVGSAVSSSAAGQKGDVLVGARYAMTGLHF